MVTIQLQHPFSIGIIIHTCILLLLWLIIQSDSRYGQVQELIMPSSSIFLQIPYLTRNSEPQDMQLTSAHLFPERLVEVELESLQPKLQGLMRYHLSDTFLNWQRMSTFIWHWIASTCFMKKAVKLSFPYKVVNWNACFEFNCSRFIIQVSEHH